MSTSRSPRSRSPDETLRRWMSVRPGERSPASRGFLTLTVALMRPNDNNSQQPSQGFFTPPDIASLLIGLDTLFEPMAASQSFTSARLTQASRFEELTDVDDEISGDECDALCSPARPGRRCRFGCRSFGSHGARP